MFDAICPKNSFFESSPLVPGIFVFSNPLILVLPSCWNVTSDERKFVPPASMTTTDFSLSETDDGSK